MRNEVTASYRRAWAWRAAAIAAAAVAFTGLWWSLRPMAPPGPEGGSLLWTDDSAGAHAQRHGRVVGPEGGSLLWTDDSAVALSVGPGGVLCRVETDRLEMRDPRSGERAEGSPRKGLPPQANVVSLPGGRAAWAARNRVVVWSPEGGVSRMPPVTVSAEEFAAAARQGGNPEATPLDAPTLTTLRAQAGILETVWFTYAGNGQLGVRTTVRLSGESLAEVDRTSDYGAPPEVTYGVSAADGRPTPTDVVGAATRFGVTPEELPSTREAARATVATGDGLFAVAWRPIGRDTISIRVWRHEAEGVRKVLSVEADASPRFAGGPEMSQRLLLAEGGRVVVYSEEWVGTGYGSTRAYSIDP